MSTNETSPSTHTPGPWEAVTTYENLHHHIQPADKKAKRAVGQAFNYKDAPEESLANAHLIAAAPDLLEALEALVSVSDALPDNNYALKLSYNAIAKATGRR